MSGTRPMVSVCMATFRGEKYIAEQMDSILGQLSDGDELVVSDDGSNDGTREVLNFYENADSRIRLLEGPRRGVVANFDSVIASARGEVLFLSDQDDVWLPGKVERMLAEFEDPGCLVAVHDAELMDGMGTPLGKRLFELRGGDPGFLSNYFKNSYTGCCMAVRADFREVFLPIPKSLPYHDWWIGLLSELQDGSRFVPDALLRYRRHGGNVSPSRHYSVPKMIHIRALYAWELARRRRALGL